MSSGQIPCLSPLAVEKLMNSEGWVRPLSPELASHVERCGKCSALLTEAGAQEEHFRQVVVRATLPALKKALAEPAEPEVRAWFRFRTAWLGAAAVAVLVAVLAVPVYQWYFKKEEAAGSFSVSDGPDKMAAEGDEGQEAYIGVKGVSGIDLYVKRGDETFRFSPGTPLHPKDRMRLHPYSPDFEFVMVVYRDPAGKYEVIHPWQGGRSAAVEVKEAGEGEPVDGALLLDGNLGMEYICALFSHSPLDVSTVSKWFDESTELPVPGEKQIGGRKIEFVVVSYRKEGP